MRPALSEGKWKTSIAGAGEEVRGSWEEWWDGKLGWDIVHERIYFQ